ncbi:hypothetical protein LSCM1_04855 [Leishmania martiniquensis]|uniref:Uncharacterized protein n=1 Tax=Leishmania martiniquensis TaxID=1580590 RepID=A0A836GJS1_9TRYP|nr:hypothetical protein LSCM1_04855 [Leishmania martiniquensis]
MHAIVAPSCLTQALHLLLLLCMLAPGMVVVDASPAYLLAHRRGGAFTYEAKSDPVIGIDHLLPNASCSFLYAFTEDMNLFIKSLFSSSVMESFGNGAEVHSFGDCRLLSVPQNDWNTTYALSGCFKTLLHAGIAGDCVAENPFCCVQYWRYPPSLPDRLPSDQIDPRLIFWDGTKAVNGFYTNFSDEYRSQYKSCAHFRPWPQCACTYVANSTLAVDANGEWRYTRRYMPFLTYIEHRVDNPTGSEAVQLTLLEAAAASAWAAAHKFGKIPLVAPIILSAGLVVVLFILLLLMYLCGYKPALKKEEALRTKIEDLQAQTAAAEAKLAAKRRPHPRSSTSFAQMSQESFVASPKTTPSPLKHNWMPSHNASFKSVQPHVLPLDPQQEPCVHPVASVTNPGILSPQQLRGSFTAVRSRVDTEHQHPSSMAISASSRMGSPVSASASAFNAIQASSIVKRSPSTASMRSSTMRQSPQGFQNPLIGRQTFGE